MPFQIICLETKEPWRNYGCAAPYEWATGEQAAEAADQATLITGKKYKPLRINGDPNAWKQREKDRFRDGIYTPLPWSDAKWFRGSIGETEHFAHVSKEKPGMVAFTESPEKGEADLRTRIKPGTYLDRFFAQSLNKLQIQEYARAFAGKYETNGLKFATTEDEIARVYINGPRSCMSGPETGLYQSPRHPTRAYAAGDLAVAYLERGGAIVARSVVWPEKKLRSNIYGDYDRMGPLLRKDGYKEGRLDGAKLKRIECKRGGAKYLVCPHIDTVGRITMHDDHLTIGGPIHAATTSGIIPLPEGTQCNCCSSWGHDRAIMYTTLDMGDNFLYCGDCYARRTYLCRDNNQRMNGINVFSMTAADGSRYYWSRAHFKNHGLVCAISNDYIPRDEAITLSNGTKVSPRTFTITGHCFECKSCNGKFTHDHRARSGVCYTCHNRKGKW